MAYPYENPVEPASVNMDAGKLDKVVSRFRSQQTAGEFPGGQLVLRRDGKLVLSETVGIARGFRESESITPVPVQPRTAFPVLSAGKPLAAIVIALLEDRGLLNVMAPVADIFPEFTKHGKESITTLDVLTHRSGMLMPDFVKKPHLWADKHAVQAALIDTVPAYPRGTLAYHPYEYGWLLSEIVLRVDGRELPDFFVDEIANPLQLPALRYGLAGRESDSLAFLYWLGKSKVMVAGVNVAENFEWQNSQEFLNARNPAVSLVTDAASLAAFYDFLLTGGKAPSGQQLIAEEIIHKYTSRQVLSWDRSLRAPIALGRGVMVGTWFPSNFGWWNTHGCFGHAGGYCSLAFGDYDTQISVAILTNSNRSIYDSTRRFLPFADGLRKACK
jgi:CubicO group peptidase (beta-lactamase class C family)